ncbi:MAG: UDP-N-acetylglucosamine 2-epimerase (non-hydrolyzing) [Ignavibacteriaceae bacterium]
MKIVTVVGARPQFIKSVPVSRELLQNNINEVVVHTGQHFDHNMSDIFFQQLNIPEPSYSLNINNLPHGQMTGQMLIKIEEVLLKENPDLVMVYGDTNSTIAGALAAAKLNVKVAHIEAGLRSFNMQMPEEINRIITDRISTYLFCPTDTAVINLKNEGFTNFDCKIIQSGDVMYDSVLLFSEIERKPSIAIEDEFILCTIHRQENTDNTSRLNSISEALLIISENNKIILPLHPRTKKKFEKLEIFKHLRNKVIFTNPVGYLEMIYLLKRCRLVMTDSGGLQKEAYFFDRPCLTLRDETEWVELVDNGYNLICGSDTESIIKNFDSIFSLEHDFGVSLYGDGRAAKKIVEEILK